MTLNGSVTTLLILVSCFGRPAGLPEERVRESEAVSVVKGESPFADIISSGIKDKAGNLWFVASERGVYRYDGTSFTHFTVKDGLSNNNVSCIYEDKTGTLWFGTDDGICRYDGKTFTGFPTAAADSSDAPHLKQVTGMLQDKKGNYWFTTLHQGVYRYDGKSFTSFLPGEVLLCILEDKAGTIFVGSWNHGGVFRFDGTAFTHLNGLSDDMIKCLVEDTAGNTWVGTRDHGADRYDGKSITNFSTKNGFCHNDVTCIFNDRSGNLWFGSDITEWGVDNGDACRYDGKSFTNVTAKGNLPSKTGMGYSVMTIVEDKSGNFWFGSRCGQLFRYDPVTSGFTDFSDSVAK